MSEDLLVAVAYGYSHSHTKNKGREAAKRWTEDVSFPSIIISFIALHNIHIKRIKHTHTHTHTHFPIPRSQASRRRRTYGKDPRRTLPSKAAAEQKRLDDERLATQLLKECATKVKKMVVVMMSNTVPQVRLCASKYFAIGFFVTLLFFFFFFLVFFVFFFFF